MNPAAGAAPPGTRAPRAASGAARVRTVFARDWSRRTRTLKRLAHVPHAELTPDDVHDLRVATRRLRASLSVLRHADAARDRRARRELRALGRALGECRMLDIAIRDARGYGRDTTALERRRARAYAALAREMKPARVRSLLERLGRLRSSIRGVAFVGLAPWLEKFEQELGRLLDSPPRTADERHQLRIEMKKVRYVLESLGHRSPSIEKLQDTLGKEHDLAVLQGLVGRIPAAARDERRARASGNRVMGTALRSAIRHLRAIRREITT